MKKGLAKPFLAVGQRGVVVEPDHPASRAMQDGMTGGGVPFHRAARGAGR